MIIFWSFNSPSSMILCLLLWYVVVKYVQKLLMCCEWFFLCPYEKWWMENGVRNVLIHALMMVLVHEIDAHMQTLSLHMNFSQHENWFLVKVEWQNVTFNIKLNKLPPAHMDMAFLKNVCFFSDLLLSKKRNFKT